MTASQRRKNNSSSIIAETDFCAMAKFGIGRFLWQLVYGANIVTAVLMILVGYSYLIDPEILPVIAPLGMLFPFFMVVNFLFLFFWLMFKPWKALLPFLTIIVCYYPVRMYVGINPFGNVPEKAIKVMSYNVQNFQGLDSNKLDKEDNALVHFLVDSDCDIICLQESNEKLIAESMHKSLTGKYPYSHTTTRKGASQYVSVFSKYRIVKTDSVPYESQANLSMAYTLETPNGHILLINNHLETTHLSSDDRKKFKTMMKGNMNKDSIRMESKSLYKKLMESSLKRNPQAKAVAEFIKLHKDMPIIVCGDFNEIPISYNHHIIAENLNDCFVEAGIGLGWSYRHNGMRVRIDNIMCSDHFETFKCEVLSSVNLSDHHPIVCWMDFKENAVKNQSKP